MTTERLDLKYAVVILVVLLGFWLWRKNREDSADAQDELPSSPKKKSVTQSTQPQIMLSCAVCGVHLPQSDALVGKRGSYCSAAHHQQREG